MNNRISVLASHMCGFTAVAIVGVSAAAEKESGRNSLVLEEIIVTAQKREERLQDVPISMSVLSGEKLDRSTFQGVQEALSSVPGVTIDTGGTGALGGGTQLAVRGVTAPSSFNSGSSPVGYYLDSVPFGFVRQASVPDVNVYDLDRVEALRGPQGTLYGAGSQAGVVRVLTKDANLDEFEFKTRGSFSSTDGGGDNYRGDMAVNVPIVSGKLAARAVVGYQDLSGWIDRPTRADANDARERNARLKLNAQPTEQLSIGLSAWMSRAEFGASTAADGSGRRYSIADVEPITADFDIYGLKIEYDFSAFSITSMTSYLDYVGETDFGQNPAGTGPLSHFVLPARTFAQEVNFASVHEGRWHWTAGGIYRDSQDRHFQEISRFFIFPQSLKHISESWALFGELTRVFLDGQLEFTAGLRHFEDEVGVREYSRFGNVQPVQYINRDAKFSATTPRLILTWKPHNQMTVYASYAEGFRSGFEQLPSVLAGVPALPPVKPDELTNYELGTKGSLLGGRIGFESAVYYMDWQDVQLPLGLIIDGVGRSAAVNGASASGIGVDAALTTKPIEGLELGVNFSWNDLTLDRDVFSFGIPLFDEGDRLPLSIETTVGAQVIYAFPLGGRGLEGRFSASANWTSEKPNKVLSGTTVLVQSGDPIAIGRASFSIQSPDRWSASLFVDNLNNERDATFRAVDLVGNVTAFYPRPRTIGLQLDYRL